MAGRAVWAVGHLASAVGRRRTWPRLGKGRLGLREIIVMFPSSRYALLRWLALIVPTGRSPRRRKGKKEKKKSLEVPVPQPWRAD